MARVTCCQTVYLLSVAINVVRLRLPLSLTSAAHARMALLTYAVTARRPTTLPVKLPVVQMARLNRKYIDPSVNAKYQKMLLTDRRLDYNHPQNQKALILL
jgi:hypothetical protein